MMQQTSESGLWPSFRFDLLYIFVSHIIYVVKEVTIIQEGGETCKRPCTRAIDQQEESNQSSL